MIGNGRTPNCRFCGEALAQTVLDLGEMPLANGFLTEAQLALPEPTYPLHTRVCNHCLLVQIDRVVTPEALFAEYAYFSSYSASWVEHARRFAAKACDRFGLGDRSFVVEIASNDGYLLRHFVAKGIPVLGVEPARNVATVAESHGVPTIVDFFGTDLAASLVAAGKSADLVVGNNVFAHVPGVNDFVAGLAMLLKPQGIVSLEFPHLLRLIEQKQFDTIYHEHVFYFSLMAVERIFAAHGLRVFDVEELPTHGGSLRVLGVLDSCQEYPTNASVTTVRAKEQLAGLERMQTYGDFAVRVAEVKQALLAFLRRSRTEGQHVAAYGAAAKGNTLLNFCEVGPDLLDYVVDASPHKQGRYLPGSHLPVYSPDRLAQTRPAYVLILPWNLREEITASAAHIREWGGRFVVPVPTTEVLQ